MSLSLATEHLENAFTEVDSKITNLTNRIDSTFIEGLEGPTEKGPAELMQTLISVRKEFNTIVKEVSELQKAQEKMFNSIMEQLQNTQDAASSLTNLLPNDEAAKK